MCLGIKIVITVGAYKENGFTKCYMGGGFGVGGAYGGTSPFQMHQSIRWSSLIFNRVSFILRLP